MDQETPAEAHETPIADSSHAGADNVDAGREYGAFQRLPIDVIQKILYTVDANAFASLSVLNQQWRKASNNPELYAHHISRCPLFAVSSSIIDNFTKPQNFKTLKGMFAREMRRNAFDIFLRPRTTHVTLISSCVGSATALPIGEALKFSFSSNGHILLCLSSSRICVLDLVSPEIKVLHELKTSRMPLAATILDDGRVLAVVSNRHQVNIYHLTDREAKHVQVLSLNDVPRALALAPNGNVLGIAYDGSIEVYALGENILPTQRRAVRCGKVDELAFSSDGAFLLGSSLDHPEGGFVTITAPFPSDSMVDVSDYQTQIWTTQILFPDLVSGYSHVTMFPNRVGDDDNWIIGFDNTSHAFRAVRANDSRTGAIYFPGPASAGGLQEYSPSLSPAVDPNGELVALAFREGGLWLYGIPDDMNVLPLEGNGTLGVNGTRIFRNSPQGTSPGNQDDETVARRLKRTLNQPSLMVQGHKIADIPGLTAAHWVTQRQISDGVCSARHRLVVVAPGGVTSASLGDEAIPVDGGRLSIFDFEPSTKDGDTVELTIELGEAEPLLLKEQNANLEQEVELERRRTRMHRGPVGTPRVNMTERSAASRQSFPASSSSHKHNNSNSNHNHRGSRSQVRSSATENEIGDVTLFLDGPYSNTAPRSGDTIRRAATAAASNRRAQHRAREHDRRPAVPLLQIPHESDADNWVPPPPPYTRNPDEPLPEHLRQLLLPTMTAPPGGVMEEVPQPMRRVHTNQGTQPERPNSSFLSRRWSIRRPTTNGETSRRRLSFRQSSVPNVLPSTSPTSQREQRPGSRGRLSLSGMALQARLNHPVPPVPGTESEIRTSSISQQSPGPVQEASRPITSSTGTQTAGVQRGPSRASRLFAGSFRKSSKQSSPNPQLERSDSIARSMIFSRSSPNLAVGRAAALQRMSTIYSNSSRPGDQGGVSRSRSRSETVQPPARLTEAALRTALQNQGVTNQQPQSRFQQVQVPDSSSPDGGWQHPSFAETEAWRMRIAEWNENTINERKQSKSKTGRCIVM
ncbi:Serine/arginine repetitive matrix protein 2 [Talaromyces islandicus]|uniref:Serine/arginine repetitive matrix protein 2 n=1 Tax=Talaromyces islandicus TaxID=28573 RepID=A0A0U1LZ21_TALIS|nr:Serine/arginine repetitive matrix protein 2 [Talaromyces islandicus]